MTILRILLIEDDAPSSELASYLLSSAGHDVLTAAAGDEGLAIALRERPDVLLCDLNLPVVDGFRIARQLMKETGYGPPLRIALTAMSMLGDRERALNLGFHGYMTKPITPETFCSEVEHLASTLRAED
jgi:CheY-like chemotaxis protein